MLAYLFINSPRGYLAAFLIVAFTCSLLAAVFFWGLYRMTTRESKRYRAHIPKRVQLPREEPYDLEAERQHHLLLKERHEEEDLRMRRAS